MPKPGPWLAGPPPHTAMKALMLGVTAILGLPSLLFLLYLLQVDLRRAPWGPAGVGAGVPGE